MTKDLLKTLGLRKQYQQGRDLLVGLNKIETKAASLLEHLYGEITSGLWCDERIVNAIEQGRQQHALHGKEVDEFIAAHDGKHDLPLTSWSVKRADALLPAGEELLQLLDFFDKATESSDPESPQPAFWTRSLLQEASLHLYDLLADDMRQRARAAWQPVFDALRQNLDGWPIDAPLQLLDMLYQIGELEEFEAVYDSFRQRYGSEANLFPWLGHLLLDATFRKQYLGRFGLLLKQIITVKQLRHRVNDPDLNYLQRLYSDIQAWGEMMSQIGELVSLSVEGKASPSAPPAILPTPNIVGFKLPLLNEMQRLKETLAQVTAALDSRHAWGNRRAAVLGFWHAFLLRHSLDLEGCREVLAQLPESGEALRVLVRSLRGELAYFAGDYEDAQLHLQRSQALAERLLRRFQEVCLSHPTTLAAARAFLGRLCQWRGNAFVFLGDYALATTLYEQVNRYLHDAAPEAQVMQAVNQGNLAFMQHNLVDHRGYVTYDEKERSLLVGDAPEPFLRLKWDKNRCALAQAEQHYRAGLQYMADMGEEGAQKRWEAIISANIGNVYWARARLLNEAAQLPAGLPDDMRELGAPDELYRMALALQQQAYATAIALPQPDRPLAAGCMANIAELMLLLGDHAGAEQAAATCLTMIGRDSEADIQGAAHELLTGEGEFYPENCWRIYLTLARVYEGRGDIAQATLAYERALKTVEIMRSLIRCDEWQVTALHDKQQVYECYIHFLYHTDRSANAARIFDLSEQLKARAFLELLDAARLNLEELVPAELCEQRTRLGARLNLNNLSITQELRRAEAQPGLIDRLVTNQRKLVEQWQVLQSHIEHSISDKAGELNPPTRTWAHFQQFLALQPDTVVLSFTVGNDQSYLLVGDADTLTVCALPGRAAIEFAVGCLLWHVRRTHLKGVIEFVAANRHLVGLLLGPAIAEAGLLERLQGKRILIVPDGMLYYLPFELLLVMPPTNQQGKPLDPTIYQNGAPATDAWIELSRDLLPFYLLQVGPIAYAQSASVWHELQQRALGNPARLALGIYRINYSAPKPIGQVIERLADLVAQYTSLEGTRRIARVLDKLSDNPAADTLRLSTLDEDGTPWRAELQSTEENFKHILEAHSVRYLIFAGHGVYHDKHPDSSGIIFNLAPPPGLVAQSNGKAVADGFFGLKDIFCLKVPDTELIFLAACQSGLGVLSRGEGINALTRAFMYRGSPTVVASLWTVDEDSTLDLVEAFFAALRKHPEQDKAQLLQEAKQAVSRDTQSKGIYAHPYYWAPFVLLGKR